MTSAISVNPAIQPEFIRVHSQSSSGLFSVVRRVFETNLAPLYGNQDKALSQIVKGGDRKCELLMDGQKAVGLILYKRDPQNEFQRYGIVESLELKTLSVIDPKENSGKGYGSALVDRVIAVARETFAKGVHVTVSNNADGSLLFFQRKGFVHITKWNGIYIKGVDEHLLAIKFKEIVAPSSFKRKAGDMEFSASKREKAEAVQPQGRVDFRPAPIQAPARAPRPGVSHSITLYPKYIDQIRSGGKTIEGRINSGMCLAFKAGDTIRFFHPRGAKDVNCSISAVRSYRSFAEMLQKEGHQKCLTDVRSLQEAVTIYDKIPGYSERAARSGVLAFEIKVIG